MRPRACLPALAAALVLVLALTSACGSSPTVLSSSPAGSADPSDTATGIARADMGDTPTARPPRLGGVRPGALLRSRSIELAPLTTQGRAKAYQVDYLSENAAGQTVRTTGTVVIPVGAPPDGGWPVVAYGHPSSGIIPPCAPSAFADLGGNVGAVTPLVRLGLAVVISDYQGMRASSNGYQPFLVPEAGAADLTDLVRASRRLSSQLSTRWVALGLGDGGNAAWAANAAAARQPESSRLRLVGSVSVSPLVGVWELAELSAEGELTKAQLPLMILLLQTMSQEVPGFEIDRYRSARAAEWWPRFFQCGGLRAPAFNPLFDKLRPDDLGPRDPADEDALRDALRRFSLAGRTWQPSAPMLVLYGGRDTTIRPDWVKDRLAAVCRRQGVVTQGLDEPARRDGVDASAVTTWITDRFAGRSPTNSCGRLR